MDLNNLNLTFEVDSIYLWSCAHQTLLVSTSHPNFAQMINTKNVKKNNELMTHSEAKPWLNLMKMKDETLENYSSACI